MAVQGLNHAVLYVRDSERSARFYIDVLGFERTDDGKFPGAAFLRAGGSTNDHHLGLFSIGADAADSPAGRGAVGTYHLAWEVDTLGALASYAKVLTEVGALVGASDHGMARSLYARDLDGLELELAWFVPAALVGPSDRPGIRPLDLDADIARFGADTLGGVGFTRPVPSEPPLSEPAPV